VGRIPLPRCRSFGIERAQVFWPGDRVEFELTELCRGTCSGCCTASDGSLPDACTQSASGSDGPDRITLNEYNEVDQPKKVRSGVGTALVQDTVVTTYGVNGLPSTLADAKGNLTSYGYDGFNRLVKTSYPSASNGAVSSGTDYEELTLDAAGRPIQQRLRDGNTVTLGYDGLGRLASRVGSNVVARSYAYDNLGRLTGATLTPTGQSASASYDALGRQVSAGSPQGTLGYQYDAAGRRTRLTWPDGFYVTYEYDTVGELTRILENGSVSLVSFGYDTLGNRLASRRTNGSKTFTGYYGGSRLFSIQEDMVGSAYDGQATFEWNSGGQLKSRTLSNDGYAFAGYVNVGRSYAANGLNQYTQSGPATPTYDGRGNLTSTGTGTDWDVRI
jgi:YD repeat-containing protein